MPIAILLLVLALAGTTNVARAATPGTTSRPCAGPVADNHLAADATRTGVISLRFRDAEGARVTFFECVGGQAERLGARRVAFDPATRPLTSFEDAVTWSCDRLVRRFAAVAALPSGEHARGAYSVRTLSCAQRFELRVPRRVAPGASVRVGIVDRWGIGGIRTRLCVAAERRAASCRALELRHAVTVASRSFRATARGRWQVELRVRGHRTRAFVRAGAGAIAREQTPPTVLATGDSTMQGIDSFLADELGDAATVQRDVLPGSALSRGHFWTRHARAQTTRLRQRVTVISIGAAGDGLPLPGPDGALLDCCGAPWVLAYRGRARETMLTYLRGGRGRVFWLTPPLPRSAPRATIAAAVNGAVLRAAAGLAGVTVVRVDRFFSPNGYSRDDPLPRPRRARARARRHPPERRRHRDRRVAARPADPRRPRARLVHPPGSCVGNSRMPGRG